ncbi:hypothetical protein OGAPHI_007299 [Ogataea philodendri]|uniref:Uncharacterized protein n=1 Tax=Ogataea philodendri TaxID=1378263 RepID=A0A9P8SZH3_9ASCO|nr:uncharacterized protein OGAPHI_007299 [Ogataea philodendri]KAH3660094.1 hypothetical protein OGAPHI_007299 [Ogataea philodendri]
MGNRSQIQAIGVVALDEDVSRDDLAVVEVLHISSGVDPSSLVVNVLHSVRVFLELWILHAIGHNDIFHNVGRVRGDPETRRAEPACPEVDCGVAELRVGLEPVGQHLVRRPQNHKVGSENHGWNKTFVDGPQSVVFDQLDKTIDRTRVHFGLGVVLHLKSGLELLYWCRNKRHVRDPSMTESMSTHPTRGGVKPLYKPRIPSYRRVFNVQSKGPLNRPSEVCRRTLTESNGCPTAFFIIPENTPAIKPAYLGGCLTSSSTMRSEK